MPTMTYTPLANVTLGSTASSVTFSSIPATYRDLILVITSKTATTPTDIRGRFNSDTGANYNRVAMATQSNSVVSFSNTGLDSFYIWGTGDSAGAWGVATMNIMDYSATDKHKTILSRGNALGGFAEVEAQATRWASTSAMTSILLFPATSSFAIGSTFNLFGVIA